jgi:hypothetical protein
VIDQSKPFAFNATMKHHNISIEANEWLWWHYPNIEMNGSENQDNNEMFYASIFNRKTEWEWESLYFCWFKEWIHFTLITYPEAFIIWISLNMQIWQESKLIKNSLISYFGIKKYNITSTIIESSYFWSKSLVCFKSFPFWIWPIRGEDRKLF